MAESHVIAGLISKVRRNGRQAEALRMCVSQFLMELGALNTAFALRSINGAGEVEMAAPPFAHCYPKLQQSPIGRCTIRWAGVPSATGHPMFTFEQRADCDPRNLDGIKSAM
jgi:hypothetical protein